ncbi:MAG: hypothetical protein ACI9GW_002769 [Halieaceae bacterium]|jgi:hypothetical protein
MIKYRRTLLALGAMVGALLAGTGLLKSNDQEPPKESVAVVNGTSIGKTEYLSNLQLQAREKRRSLGSAERLGILERMIEEQLLVERGLTIGIVESDPAVRKAIITAMIESALKNSAATDPTPSQLSDFYRENVSYFSSQGQLQVQRMVFRTDPASVARDENSPKQRASTAHQALSASNFAEVRQRHADPDILSLPSSPLPITKLHNYLGPTLSQAAAALQPGHYSEPLPDGTGYTILMLISRTAGSIRPLDSIREEVVHEYKRRAGDRALREYLGNLRKAADIRLDKAFIEELEELDDLDP